MVRHRLQRWTNNQFRRSQEMAKHKAADGPWRLLRNADRCLRTVHITNSGHSKACSKGRRWRRFSNIAAIHPVPRLWSRLRRGIHQPRVRRGGPELLGVRPQGPGRRDADLRRRGRRGRLRDRHAHRLLRPSPGRRPRRRLDVPQVRRAGARDSDAAASREAQSRTRGELKGAGTVAGDL
ncbi:hypothetical protein ZEAMMB73_Zm00001d008286, partial [Zea mays]